MVAELPKFHEFMRPLLEVLVENGEMHRHDAVAATIEKVGLTKEQKSICHETNGKYIAQERVGWASSYLSQAGCLERPKRGYMAPGKNAKAFLELNRPIKVSDVKSTNEWKALRAAKIQAGNNEIESPNELEDETPQDLINKGVKILQSQLIDEILLQIKTISPASFESLILQVLAKMGYGGGDTKRIQGVPRGPDGGIDGIIDEDKLGLDQIYIQAKRYSENSVGRPTVQSFIGAMTGGGCRKGVFVTSSTFTSEAKKFAEGLNDVRLVLIDGVDLAKLMIEYSVGVQFKETIRVAKIDQDFFSGDE